MMQPAKICRHAKYKNSLINAQAILSERLGDFPWGCLKLSWRIPEKILIVLLEGIPWNCWRCSQITAGVKLEINHEEMQGCCFGYSLSRFLCFPMPQLCWWNCSSFPIKLWKNSRGNICLHRIHRVHQVFFFLFVFQSFCFGCERFAIWRFET